MISDLRALTLETERLSIRPIGDSDVSAVYQIHIDDEVNRYLPYETWQTWDDAKHWYAKILQRRADQEAEQFVIIRRDDQQLVGTIIVFGFKKNDKSCEFGYVLNRDYWRHGYMLEATRALLTSLLSMNELGSVRAVVDGENSASLALLSKLGFAITARLKEEKSGNSGNKETCYLRIDSY